MNFIKFSICIFISSLLFACGGGSADSSGQETSNVFIKRPAQTGLPYYPMTSGTYLAFSISRITAAHWDWVTNELIVDSRGSNVNRDGYSYLVEQYSTNTCASFPGQMFYVNSYSFNNSGQPSAGSVDLNKSLQDGIFVDENGVQYLGEAINGLRSDFGGEPVISANPVAGEHIHRVQTWYGPYGSADGGCANSQVVETGFQTDYYTVRHVDNWNGFSDVWITSLIERANTNNPSFYGYAYALGIGQVGSWCWADTQDNYSCGNEYIALKQ